MRGPQELLLPPFSVPNAVRRRLSLSGKPLTPAELEILRWAAGGKTVWEISRIRATSEATVKFHLRNIYCKLQVTNRVQAMNEAARQGLC
ncbi:MULTISPECIES: response regulator transcription factor [Pseudomonas]|uniref:response regulator transcription factor n=1 Tax=Pseudomonas TaxID=286 RepID=UPI000CFD9051|nr:MULTISPECIES: helix-turn-helix transcriptional regulator [Pseudomonas]PQZ90985.1 helix-turn-helix transcriptional regulator [Pseudomonas trivialis]PRB26217.1 helix-turn-helix transcriptional regulator [Pseudomonas sp. MYb60]